MPADLYAEWAGAPRDRVAALRHQLLRQARRWRELLELDPLDEQAHVELMRELAGRGPARRAAVVRAPGPRDAA